MASNIQLNDFLVVGRLQASFKTQVSDLRNLIQDDLNLPDIDDISEQPGSLDDRYVMSSGDVMTGPLELPTIDPAEDYHATHKKFVLAQITNLAEGQVKTNKEDIATLSKTVSDDVKRLEEDLSNEVTRATDAEATLAKTIAEQTLGDHADVAVSGASTDQILSYNGTEWVAKTATVAEALNYKSNVDLTGVAITPPADAADGDLYVNTGSGAIESSWSITPQTLVNGGELVVYTSGPTWEIVGSIGAGLTYESFTVSNDTANPTEAGTLSYNNQSGVFTYQPVDISKLIPKNLNELETLPDPSAP